MNELCLSILIKAHAQDLSHAAASRPLRRNVMARHIDDGSAIVSHPFDPVIQSDPA